MVRVSGLDCPLDVFRRPNEVELHAFNGFFERGRKRDDGLILPHPLDLIETKLNTGRDQELRDIQFLEGKVRAEYRTQLPSASLSDAHGLLSRFSIGKSFNLPSKTRDQEPDRNTLSSRATGRPMTLSKAPSIPSTIISPLS